MSTTQSSAIVDLLRTAARQRPGELVLHDPHQELTYPDLVKRMEREAVELTAAGLRAGDLLLVIAAHEIEYLVCYFAALHVGCRLLPMDAEAPQPEVDREIARHGVGYVLRPGPGPAADRLTRTPFAEQRAEAIDQIVDFPFVCLPTSGTSGLPKRAVHRPDRLVANARAHAASVGLAEDDVCLVSLSPAFGYCHTAQILAVISVAGRLVFPPRPALPGELARLVGEHGVTTTTMVPHQLGDPMLRALGAGGSLRQLVLGGSAVTGELAERVGSRLPGVELVQTWGMTEAGPRLTTWRSGRDADRPGSVGRPLDGVQVAAAGPDGRVTLPAAPPDLRVYPGELVVSTPYLMAGYLGAPEETAAAVPAPGLLRTGDLGRVDPDGYVWLTGRLKNLIDVGGKKVSPEEIEAVLLSMPGVAAVKVRGEPDPRRGQVPAAAVVPEAGTELSVPQLRAFACARLARHKWPQHFDIVAQIDRTPNGKVLRW